MMPWEIYMYGLLAMVMLGGCTWLLSLYLHDVSIVDSVWSLMFLAAGSLFLVAADELTSRNVLIYALLLAWALRLSIHLTWRNWGEAEDRRYRGIREKYDPHFKYKSLYIIFLFQAMLAWIVAMPLWPAIGSSTTFTLLDIVGIALWSSGMFFEVVADWQLARFKANPDNSGKVMERGLWRYSRHPNYFGECLVWWGFYLFALASGAWWTIPGPLLITWLLLKFSGVVMLEETISERRPAYRNYILRTNAFIPGPRKSHRCIDSSREAV